MIDFQNAAIVKLKQSREVPAAIRDILIPGEQVIANYQAIRDYVLFTDKRIISCNVQGITGKKQDFTSMPYSKITVFSVETAGALDLDDELELYFSGVGKVHFDFSGKCDIKAIGRYIAQAVL